MKIIDSWGSLVPDHLTVARSTLILGSSMQAANFKANEILASILEQIESRLSAINFKAFCPFNCLGTTTRTDSKNELMELDDKWEIGGSQKLDQLAQSGTPLVDKLYRIHRWGVNTASPLDVLGMRLMETSSSEAGL